RRAGITSASVQAAFPISYGDALAYLVLARVEFGAGLPELDLLPLTFVPDGQAERLLAPAAAAGGGRGRGPQPGPPCGARVAPTVCQALLGMIVRGTSFPVGPGELAGLPLPGLADFADPFRGDPTPALVRGEHTNVSVAYGGQLILKVFRRVEEGAHPDL